MTNKINSWDWDVRVRERNLRSGILSEKDVEKMLGALPDVTDRVDAIQLSQPALSSGAAALSSGADDDEEEDDTDEQDHE